MVARAELCKSVKRGHQFESTKRIIDQKLYQFASSKTIAPLADETLSKLAKAQSPTLIEWGKKRNINPQNEPEKFAKEWRSFFATQFIISKYPTKMEDIDRGIESFFDQLQTDLFDEKNVTYFKKEFQKAKDLSIQKIQSSPLDLQSKNKIIQKIQDLKIYFPSKLSGSKFEKNILEFFNWGFAYDPKTNEINLGLDVFKYNEQNMKVALLHEIAHSFDSCRWSQNEDSTWPFEKIGLCLRKFTLSRDDSKLNDLKTTGYLTEEEFQFFKKNTTCHNTKYPPTGFQKDQLTETFADWFSAFAMENEKIDFHFRDDLCEERILEPGSSYLSNTDRLYKIYLSNKKFSSLRKSKSDEFRCTF